MSDSQRHEVMTREQYRRWALEQPRGRFERVDGRVVVMAAEPGLPLRLRLKLAVLLALRDAIAKAGVRCQAIPDGVTVETGESDYEPDAVVNCGEPMADDAVAAPNPVVVVEVLSRSTQAVDTGAKLVGYFQVPGIEHYMVVHTSKQLIVHHQRRPDGTGFDTRLVAAGAIVLDPPGVSVDVAAVYRV